jgi:hypothetical protein
MHTPEAKGYQLFEFTEPIFPFLKCVVCILHPSWTASESNHRYPSRSIPALPGKKAIYHARREMLSVAGRIVSDSIRASDGEKSFDSKKDLLSVLLRANLAKNVPESQRMRDDEVVSRMWSFPLFFDVAIDLWFVRDSCLHRRWA